MAATHLEWAMELEGFQQISHLLISASVQKLGALGLPMELSRRAKLVQHQRHHPDLCTLFWLDLRFTKGEVVRLYFSQMGPLTFVLQL